MKTHHRPNATAAVVRLQQKIVADSKPPKFCVNCDWHTFERIDKNDRTVFRHYCHFPPLLDVITGQPSNPAKNRNDATACGRQAQHFTPKEK